MTDKMKVSYKPINITILEDNYNELKIKNNFPTIDYNMRNNIFKHIRAIIDILKDKHRLTDKNKKELNNKLEEFNKYIKTIKLNTSNFGKIQDLINNFRTDYYDAVGIKEKENNTAENGIGLFELFEVEKKVEETNEQSMKSSSSASTETGSSTSSDSGEIKEVKEVKNKSGTTSTSSDSNENEMKEKQSDPAETPVFSEEDKEKTNEQSMKSSSSASTETSSSTSSDNCKMEEIKETKSEDDTTSTTSDSSENEMKEKHVKPEEMAVFSEEDKKSKSGSCSSARSDSSMTSGTESNEEYSEFEEEVEEKLTIEELFNVENSNGIDMNNFEKYVKQNNFSKKSLEDVVFDDRFKRNDLFVNNKGEIVVNNIFITRLIEHYKQSTNSKVKIYYFISTIFDVFTDYNFNLTNEQENKLKQLRVKQIKENCKDIEIPIEQNYAKEWCINTKILIDNYLNSEALEKGVFIDTLNDAVEVCKDKYFLNTDQVKNFRMSVLEPIFSNYEKQIKGKTDKDIKYKQFVKSVINGIIESEELNLGKDVKKELQKVINSEIKYEVSEIDEDEESFGELDKTENDIGKTSSYSTKDEKNEIKEKIKITQEQCEAIDAIKQETASKIVNIDEIFQVDDNSSIFSKNSKILSNCCEYIKSNEYSMDEIKNVVSNDKFKNAYKNSFKPNQINICVLNNNFIEPIIRSYLESHANIIERYNFIDILFDVIDEQLNLTKDKKLSKNFKGIKAKYLQEIEQKFLISISDIRTNDDNSKVVKNIDKKLKMFVEDKKQVIGNTIELIKSQKSQLQNDNVKLQKAATLLILLEVYKVNIDKFIFFNEVYKKLNDTIKNTIEKKIKKQEIDLTQSNANLAEVIKEVNEVLTKQGKESIKDINITF